MAGNVFSKPMAELEQLTVGQLQLIIESHKSHRMRCMDAYRRWKARAVHPLPARFSYTYDRMRDPYGLSMDNQNPHTP